MSPKKTLQRPHMKSTIIYLFLAGILFFQSCKQESEVHPGLVAAEYVGLSDSPCGGTHKIRVIKGAQFINSLFSQKVVEEGSIITAFVDSTFRNPGESFYFTPKPAEPKYCNAMVAWYTEVIIENPVH
jgi:hypothetical protein